MLRLILNELKIKKLSFIISLSILVVTIIFNLVLQVKFKESFEIKYVQFIYCCLTFFVIWQLNILIACSDVRNKCFIMYRSIPIDLKKFVISRYLTYSIITIIYTLIA